MIEDTDDDLTPEEIAETQASIRQQLEHFRDRFFPVYKEFNLTFQQAAHLHALRAVFIECEAIGGLLLEKLDNEDKPFG